MANRNLGHTCTLLMADLCGFLIPFQVLEEYPDHGELSEMLEKGDDEERILALKRILVLMANGDSCSGLLIYIIRFLFPNSRNKTIKRLLLIYLEQCEKRQADGALKQEMILVCNSLRNDLNHSNEYVRGMTLRFLSQLKEAEILESLIPSVRTNLDHGHPYVRKHALVAIMSIHQEFGGLIPDAPELVFETVKTEVDSACRRIGLFCLSKISPLLGFEYFQSMASQLDQLDEQTQRAIVEFASEYSCICPASEKPALIEALVALIQDSETSNAVRYEGAFVLTNLSSSMSIIRAIAKCYIELVIKESDNTLRLLILDQVAELFKVHGSVLQNQLVDVLTGISSFDRRVRGKCLDIVSENVNHLNGKRVVERLKLELERADEARPVLIASMIKCSAQSEDLVRLALPAVLHCFDTLDALIVSECSRFLESTVPMYIETRDLILQGIMDNLLRIQHASLLRTCLRILGQYAKLEYANVLLDKISKLISGAKDILPESKEPQVMSTVLDDGTYVTETSSSGAILKIGQDAANAVFYENGKLYVPVSIVMLVLRLTVRYQQRYADKHLLNQFKAKSMLQLTRMLQAIIQSEIEMNMDSVNRIVQGFWIFLRSESIDTRQFLDPEYLQWTLEEDAPSLCKPELFSIPSFSLIKEEMHREPSSKTFPLTHKRKEIGSRLDGMVQLTGLSDPVYAEAHMDIRDLDIYLDMVVVNQTETTLQNVLVEFVSGGTRSVFQSSQSSLGAFSTVTLHIVLRITSADQSIIQGYISYDSGNHIVLNTISLDVGHFLDPNDCDKEEFASLWKMLEWENKVHIQIPNTTFKAVMDQLSAQSHLKRISPPESAEIEEGDIFSSNLFASSKFGNPVLANVSLERHGTNVQGHVRIRSKSNTLAYIVGNKISAMK